MLEGEDCPLWHDGKGGKLSRVMERAKALLKAGLYMDPSEAYKASWKEMKEKCPQPLRRRPK